MRLWFYVSDFFAVAVFLCFGNDCVCYGFVCDATLIWAVGSCLFTTLL